MTTMTGGGSSAVGASTLSACERFRGTDPLLTGVSRRRLAADLGFPDDAAGIPEARWVRALTFERLVRDEAFAAQVTTTAVGALRLERPDEVAVVDARSSQTTTVRLLTEARDRAQHGSTDGGPVATLIYQPEVPFPGVAAPDATPVKPDFLIVAARPDAPRPDSSGAERSGAEGSGSDDVAWVIMGDAKDYERVRSRIDDGRLLKGYLQVALGAEALAAWSLLPAGTAVHRSGVLAVPRNSYLQPTALVEDLRDHRSEVRWFLDQRLAAAENPTPVPAAHLRATFDPASCATCSLFAYCRDELRRSPDPDDLRVELGLNADDTGPEADARLRATRDGVAQPTGQRRTDPVGRPGTVNVVVAKSDAAALGLHGIALQQVGPDGPGPWTPQVFTEPQSDTTRRRVMRTLGEAIAEAGSTSDGGAVHLVVPDPQTADVLVSIADTLAGVELSRLRWQRDLDEDREALTFDGDPARVPEPLDETTRRGVSFLLEDDRARALTLRTPVVDLRATLAQYVVAGGPEVDSQRLDYLAAWATASDPIDHRVVADRIESLASTPGARLTNRRSDEIHRALAADDDTYPALVTAELAYKQELVDDVVAHLGTLPTSAGRTLMTTLEADAQAVWRRRVEFHASDLVRFGRTASFWRNRMVEVIEKDHAAQEMITAVVNPQRAAQMASDPSSKNLTHATVVGLDPVVLDVDSRRFREGTTAVVLHVNGVAAIEGSVDITALKGSFTFGGLSLGPLENPEGEVVRPRAGTPSRLIWRPAPPAALEMGDRVILGNAGWFGSIRKDGRLSLARPPLDSTLAPKDTCDAESFADDPETHQRCCRPHEVGEAEYADLLAERRANNELNPQVWPPIRDPDAFEVPAEGAPIGDATHLPGQAPPSDLTINDLE